MMGGGESCWTTTTFVYSAAMMCYMVVGVVHAHGGSSGAGCEFPKAWVGRWFQSGVPNHLLINATYIETKGECYEEQADKYLVYDRSEKCYRCMAIHVKHPSVLQYKETFCEPKSSLQEICYGITGDAPLHSMFRKYPEAKPVPCPFKSAPFTFSYNRGAGDCSNPPSKAESCTDDSRLVLKYQACPDVASTESNVEELVCLATWKEGSTRYLVGKITQGNRRTLLTDEDQYRCFIYQKSFEKGKGIYNIAQSADATCTGLQNVFEGSRMMKFTTVDNHHNRCKFPLWITDHHTWLSLDHRKTYKFSQRNATLKILDDEPSKPIKTAQAPIPPQPAATPHFGTHFAFQEFGFESQDQRRQNSESRVICHSILLQSNEQKKVQIVAHVTAGCDSGYVCMVFHKRDTNVIEIQQSEKYQDNPDDACRHFDPSTTPFTTLVTTSLHPKKCPNLGRYVVAHPTHSTERRKKRQQQQIIPTNLGGMDIPPNVPISPECVAPNYEALTVGCSGSNELMEFRTACLQQPTNAYTCHGSWQDNDTFYVITSPISRRSTETLRYCFIYTLNHHRSGTEANSATSLNTATGKGHQQQQQQYLEPPMLRLSAVSESCHRHIAPGIDGNWAFNFTTNGTCAELRSLNSAPQHTSSLLLSTCALLLVGALRR